MVELLLWIILEFVIMTAIGALIAFRVSVKSGYEAIELRDFGRETTGRVVEKRRERRRGSWSTWIRYEYTDPFGKTHRSRRNLVTPEAWDAHEEGGPIQVMSASSTSVRLTSEVANNAKLPALFWFLRMLSGTPERSPLLLDMTF